MKLWLVRLTPAGLMLAYFAAHQGGKYYPRNALQEVALGVIGLLYLGWLAKGRRSGDFRTGVWALWMIGIPFLAVLFVVFYAVLFSLHTGASPIPSILALRYFGFILIAPVLYVSYRSGVSLERQERAFMIALLLLVLNYTFNYARLDLEVAHLSGDRVLASMAVWDQWRGFRLKPNFYSLYLLPPLAIVALRSRLSVPLRAALAIGALFALGWIFQLKPRAGMLSMTVSAVIFWSFLSSPRRTGVLVACVPLALILGSGYLVSIWEDFAHSLRHDWSFIARLQSYRIAADVLGEFPFFGFGQRSFHSISYQDLFGKEFFPGDIGIMGIAFRNGLLGVGGFIYLQLLLTTRAIRTHWAIRRAFGFSSPVVVAYAVVLVAMCFLTVTEPALYFEFGFPVVPIALGMTASWRHRVALVEASESSEARA